MRPHRFGAFGLDSVIEPATAVHSSLPDRTWQSTYDVNGRPVTLAAPGGVTRTRTYDAAGRVTKETGSGAEAATTDRNLSYDQLGQVTSLSTPTGTDAYTYNKRGLPVSASGPSGSATFGYDRDGNLTTRVDASGSATFGYANGRLASITDAATSAQIGLTYNNAGDAATINYGAGRVRTFGYDGNGRLASDVLTNGGAQSVESTTYGYDNRGSVSRKTTTGVSGAGDNTYAYDAASRLTSWSVAGGATTTYAWDASGNRTKVNSTTSTYDERDRLITSGDTSYGYTARGTMLSRTKGTDTESFSFDAFDRMISQGASSYSYDSADRIAEAGGSTFQYSGLGSDVIADGVSVFGRGPDGSVLSDKTGSQERLLLSDRHGDVVGGFDPADTALAALSDSRSFDPWGKPIARQGAVSVLGYQGSWTDPVSGQVNMKSRWYDTETGTFASHDSVDYQSGPSVLANPYLYAAANPMTLNDLDGRWPSCGVCHTVAGAVSSAVRHTVSTAAHYAGVAYHAVASAAEKVYSYGKGVVTAVVNAAAYVVGKAKQGLTRIASAVSAGIHIAADGIAWAKQRAAEIAAAAHRAAVAVTAKTKAVIAHAAKYNPLPILKQAIAPVFAGVKTVVSAAANLPALVVTRTVDVVRSTARQVQAIYTEAVTRAGDVVQAVSDAVAAAGEWTQNNWRTIAAVAAGVAVGVGCAAVTAGAGGPACAILGTAVMGAVSGALECPPGRSMASCAGSGAVAAVMAPVSDAVACASDPTVGGCAVAAMSVVPAAGKLGGRILNEVGDETRTAATATRQTSRYADGASAANGAESALNGALLRTHLRQLETYGQGGFRELESGRFRYYGNLTPAAKEGEMAGRRLVREWDPATGYTRTWHETIDRTGNIRIVRPETGGPKTHFYFDEFGGFGGTW